MNFEKDIHPTSTIPPTMQLQIIQLVFQVIVIVLMVVFYVVWLKTHKLESKMNRMITNVYFLSRIVGQSVSWFGVFVVFMLTLVDPVSYQNQSNILD